MFTLAGALAGCFGMTALFDNMHRALCYAMLTRPHSKGRVGKMKHQHAASPGGKQPVTPADNILGATTTLDAMVNDYLQGHPINLNHLRTHIETIINAGGGIGAEKEWIENLSQSELYKNSDFFVQLCETADDDNSSKQSDAQGILEVMKEYFVAPLVASNYPMKGRRSNGAAHVSRVNNRFVATRAGLSAGAAGALAFPNVGGGDGDERSGEARVEAEAVSPAKRQRTEVAEDGFASALGELVSQRVSQLDFGFIMGRAEIVSRIDAAVEGRVAELVGGDVITGAVRSAVSKGVAEALRSEESRVSTRVGELVAHGLRPEAVESAVEQSIGSAVRKIVAETLRAKFT